MDSEDKFELAGFIFRDARVMERRFGSRLRARQLLPAIEHLSKRAFVRFPPMLFFRRTREKMRSVQDLVSSVPKGSMLTSHQASSAVREFPKEFAGDRHPVLFLRVCTTELGVFLGEFEVSRVSICQRNLLRCITAEHIMQYVSQDSKLSTTAFTSPPSALPLSSFMTAPVSLPASAFVEAPSSAIFAFTTGSISSRGIMAGR